MYNKRVKVIGGILFDIKKVDNDEEYVLWMSSKGVYWSVTKLGATPETPSGAAPYRSAPDIKQTRIVRYEQYIPWRSISSVVSSDQTFKADMGQLVFYINGIKDGVIVPFRLSNVIRADAVQRAIQILSNI